MCLDEWLSYGGIVTLLVHIQWHLNGPELRQKMLSVGLFQEGESDFPYSVIEKVGRKTKAELLLHFLRKIK